MAEKTNSKPLRYAQSLSSFPIPVPLVKFRTGVFRIKYLVQRIKQLLEKLQENCEYYLVDVGESMANILIESNELNGVHLSYRENKLYIKKTSDGKMVEHCDDTQL
jgi:hypothetical protein